MWTYLHYLLIAVSNLQVRGYSRPHFAFTNFTVDNFDLECIPPPEANVAVLAQKLALLKKEQKKLMAAKNPFKAMFLKSPSISLPTSTAEKDSGSKLQIKIHTFLFGPKVEDRTLLNKTYTKPPNDIQKLQFNSYSDILQNLNRTDVYPDGGILRSETFNGKVAVHIPPQELHYPGHCRLRVTDDKMQTAINAYAILLYCNSEDIEALPADYVLRSARTIAMMKIAREKFAATWKVVKGNKKPIEIDHATLEMYRPLFKYLDGREMARLNLSDPKILTYIGTHADLNRHQVGIIASKFVKMKPDWLNSKNLNLMNNLLCGMPMNLMRKASSNLYLQLTQQVFYHITACDSLQRSFYLNLMTKTQALGRSYSWSARDVARLGFLLAELQGPDFAAIDPKAMAGITAQVMLKIPPEVLTYVTSTQLKYLAVKPLNILSRKLKDYQDKQMAFGLSDDHASGLSWSVYLVVASELILVMSV